jgi:DNA-binding NtrC family response regulator
MSKPTVIHPSMDRVYELARRVAAGPVNVLICGETGVGKERLARLVHDHSPRASKPFVRINCAALPSTLLESELFGHERGAFTGATQAKAGLLQVASGGTLFLDEFGELSPDAQAKLLRALGEGEARRVGGHQSYTIDVRFVAATNRDLRRDIASGAFREDLYYRVAAVAISIPPLRERTTEIEPLAYEFLATAAAQMGDSAVPQLSPAARALLTSHRWPGNVRELRNMMHTAVLLAAGAPAIEPQHLPELTEIARPASSSGPVVQMARGTADAPRWLAPLDPIPAPEQPVDDWSQLVLRTLQACGGNQTETARRLGMSRTTLGRHLDRLSVPRPRKRSA